MPPKLKTLAILQARSSSHRLPAKVLKPILGQPMLMRQIERIRRAKEINKLVVATSVEASDDHLAGMCAQNDIECFRGSLDDVLDRFYVAAKHYHPEYVVRLTGDCPLTDPEVIDQVLRYFFEGGFDYATNGLQPTYPDGLDVEVMRFESLQVAWKEAKLPSERQHVTPFIHGNPERFRIGHYRGASDHSFLRWTVDEPLDFELVTQIYETLYPENPNFGSQDILDLLEKNPALKTWNTQIRRNEGYAKSLKEDGERQMDSRYQKSEELLERAQRTIPLGSQTFSKSKTQFPFGVSPYFIKCAKGSRAWDVDGNEYVDFINSLAAVTLGYNDPDVTSAVKAQLEDGVIFSLPHSLEMQVAEKIVEMVPCAEKVRFGKNGSDATSGAIRLARAYTGRDHVAICGYHGWQDWYIGATARNLGVPVSTRELTHTFTYNDVDSLHRLFEKHPGEFAAVILEPMNTTEPKDNFLEKIKELTAKNGAVLVFDETVTGFRYSNGGAQEFFNVTPDLSTFGKGLANGYPVSAVAGRSDIMKLMEEVFFSFTFGGEALSLAAALATLTKLQKEPVLKVVARQGQKIISEVARLIEKHQCQAILSISGHPSWSILGFKDTASYTQWDMKTLFLQEMFARGILILSSHNMSYAHTDEDLAQLLRAYDEVLPLLRNCVERRSLREVLRCKPLEPLFKLR